MAKTTSKPSKKTKRVNPHKTFKRSYREDYVRETNVPGIMHHIFATFGMIFRHWKLFLPLLVLTVLIAIFFVGLMNEETYQQFQDVMDKTGQEYGIEKINTVAKAGLLLLTTITTGGLSGGNSDAAGLVVMIIFLIIWLTTVFLIRHIMAGHKVKLRDGLYNAMTPLVSSFAVFIIAIVQCIPLFFLVIVWSAAIQTEFLATPFYALVFFIFAALMILLSGYLLSSTLMALVAVTAPGMYPMRAMHAASDLMMGRRIKFVIRLIALIMAVAVMWVIVMMPVILFDLFMKQFEWTAGIPLVPVCLLTMTCFTGIYISAYLYLFYRYMLES